MNQANQNQLDAGGIAEMSVSESLPEYLAQLAAELATLARKGQFGFLEYIFNMAAKEALRIASTREKTIY